MRRKLTWDRGRVSKITLIAENKGDKEILELVWRKEINRDLLVYKGNTTRLEATVSEFDR